MTPFEMVTEFHKTYNVPINTEFTPKLQTLRANLIDEETKEAVDELIPHDLFSHSGGPDRAKLTKELADLLYVTIGAAVTFGLPLEEAFTEVHRSNMSKLGEDGKPVYRADGKVLKGPNYFEPNMEQFFDK